MAKKNRAIQPASAIKLTKADLQSSGPSGAEAEEMPLLEYGERGLILPEFQSTVPRRGLSAVAVCEVGQSPEMAAEAIIDRDNRRQIVDTTKSPFRAICHLHMVFPGSRFTWLGTGTFIGPRTVLTAGHNMFQPAKNGKPADTASSIIVTRGKNGEANPVAAPVKATPENFFWPKGWDRGEKLVDFGAIVFDEDVLTDFIGFRSFSPSEEAELRGLTVMVVGYPGQEQHPRPSALSTMWGHASRIARFDDFRLFYDIDTTPGQSGSSVIYMPEDGKYYSIGIHNYGDDERRINMATRISDDIFDLIAQWK